MSDLRKAQQTYDKAADRAAGARARRDELILRALAAGWTHQRIANATGLTRGRINQIRGTSAQS